LSFFCELPTLGEERLASFQRFQNTLSRSVVRSGIGLFTGEKVSLGLFPAEADTGIIFQRIDLPHRPIISASLDHVQGTPRCTQIGESKVLIQTVEHLLSALKAYDIDNARIELSGSEVPIFDGSSIAFTEMLEEAGVSKQEKKVKIYSLSSPVFWSEGETHLIALPSNEYKISYTLCYPHSAMIGTQYYSLQLTSEKFKTEIAPSRTFSLYEEIVPMIEKGFIKGGSLENAVVVKDNAIVNPEGTRFQNEMVRHKILDVIGDLSLIGIPFLAHVIAIRSGHTSNVAFAKKLFNHIKMENL